MSTSCANCMFGVVPQVKLAQVLQCKCTNVFSEHMGFEGMVERVG